MKDELKKAAVLVFAAAALSAADYDGARVVSKENPSVSATAVLGDAYNAYAEGDWQSALFLFKKALSDMRNQSEDSLYMLIMAGMKCGEYKSACADIEYFLSSYPQSEYAPLIKYQLGRALFCLKDYDKALIVLGDFCHESPDNMMYSSALFWIGECFYVGYNFDEAAPFYERIVNDFPSSPKVTDAQYRLDAINARKREAKLLHMLQETGENYLASKEDYEKTLRRYELENSLGTRARSAAPENDGEAELYVFDAEDEEISQDEQNAEAFAAREERPVLPGGKISPEELLRLKVSALEAEMLIQKEMEKK